CGTATSAVAKASPAIAGQVGKRLLVGNKFRDAVTLAGGYSPTGSITFAIYAPGTSGCAKPSFVNTVAVNGNGTYRSDPFVAKRAGNYRFVATYSGDASNRTATEPCDGANQLARVQKRTPKLRPLARLVGGQQISIRARLSAASSPTGTIAFRLYGPNDKRCSSRPAFAGSLRVKANGAFPLAEYIATKPGTYRLALSYSGDPRNRSSKVSCAASQAIVISRTG
ncbi:MAG TPA: hypothetical protein VFB52_02790, partial [Solirubrobacterales bacterium]|nr:hypothetical protein [Solirubrobacterales bacterium]